jgi:curved DNA-binding protein CbpA
VAPTHYEVLGVSRQATAAEVRAAYRAAARDHHPDAGGEAHRMRELNAAWQVLGDPVRRAAYDRALARGPAGAHPGGSGPPTAPGAGPVPGADWMPYVEHDLTAEEWADLADGSPLRETMALEGWWAIAPPATVVAALFTMFLGVWFTSPPLVALAVGLFALALGLFVLAPLRAMAKRPPKD